MKERNLVKESVYTRIVCTYKTVYTIYVCVNLYARIGIHEYE